MSNSDTYDYIICGGGTSGCALAGRLAEDSNVEILVIEAGGHSDAAPAAQIPMGTTQMIASGNGWSLVDASNPVTGGRQDPLPRGKVLGGSSTLNATMCIRGSKTDYDDWGVPGWGGDEIHSYMAKAETFMAKDGFQAATDAHGTNGPILVGPAGPTLPIDERMRDSFASKGISFESDMLTRGGPTGHCDLGVYTVDQGIRSHAAAYLTKGNLRSNVTIVTNALVDKVNFEQNERQLQAKTVDALLADGSRKTYKTRREIILSAGSYCTPTILLRSGIGPKDELAKHEISQVLDLPGVGQNLQDHLIVYAPYEVSKPDLTNDHQIWHEGAMQKSMQEYGTTQTGYFSRLPFGYIAWTNLDDRLQDSPLWKSAPRQPGRDPMGQDPKLQPSVEIWNTQSYLLTNSLPKNPFVPPKTGQFAFTAVTELFAPQSRGSVTLKSADPKDQPVIQHNYLSDELDLLVLAEGCRFANEIVTEGAGTKDIVAGSWPPASEAKHHTYTTREQWAEYVRDNATTCFHPASTCAMGSKGAPSEVVDEQLRVRGVRGLRVADVSVLPKLISGHTQMVAYAIGEKAADLLKDEYMVGKAK